MFRKIARVLHHFHLSDFQIVIKGSLDVSFMINMTLPLIWDTEKGNVRLDWKIVDIVKACYVKYTFRV